MRRRAINVLAIGQSGTGSKDEPPLIGWCLIGQALTSNVSFLARLPTHSPGQKLPLSINTVVCT